MKEHEQYPAIYKAAKELAALNNCPESGFDLDAFDDLLSTHDQAELLGINKWLESISPEDLQTLLDGDEEDQAIVNGRSPRPSTLFELLNEIFDWII